MAAEDTKFTMNREGSLRLLMGLHWMEHVITHFAMVSQPTPTTSSVVTQRVYIHPALNTDNKI